MTSAGGFPPGSGGYSGPGGQSGQGAHEAPAGGPNTSDGLAAEVHTLERAMFEVKRVIVGQDRLVERMLVGLLAAGTACSRACPGVAKTLAVETLAKVVGGTFARVQFTPDLVPADIIGTRIYRQSSEEFDVELGPVFVNFLLADEINRAPAKVQSALLEVMAASGRCPSAARAFPVPNPFLVMATQNPIEQEGVYPLPEAQRDRFLMKIVVGYPTDAEEREIVYRMGVRAAGARTDLRHRRPGAPAGQRGQCLRPPRAGRLRRCGVVLATRTPAQHGMPDVAQLVSYGASPRASLGLVAASPGAGAAARPRLRAAAGRARRRAGHAAAPAGAQLRRARRRDFLGDRLDRILQTVAMPQVMPFRSKDFGRPGQQAAGAASGR